MNNHKSNKSLVWMITGCGMGFGRALAETVLERGYRVLLCALDAAEVRDLAEKFPQTSLAVELNVKSSDQIARAVAAGHDKFGSLDVLVNNAGYAVVGAVEETGRDDYQPLFETNLFGPVEIIRAVLPRMRENRRGHIVNISSVGGFSASPGFGLYAATKFGLEAISEALVHELAPFGVHVTIIEPGSLRTNFRGSSMARTKTALDAYGSTVGEIRKFIDSSHGTQSGDPRKAAAAIIAVVEAADPPKRLPLGQDAYKRIREKLGAVAKDLDAWQHIGADISFADDVAGAADPRWKK